MSSPDPALIIAIDGYSACGKSTLARNLANELGYLYIDTGAMYRAVTIYFLRRELDWNDAEVATAAMEHIYLQFIPNPDDRRFEIHLNGENVEGLIRTMQVADRVSEVAAVSEVRSALRSQQREMGRKGGIVMDGRDIGTVVFPQADLKLFITASLEERIERRMNELIKRGMEVGRQEVEANLRKRDAQETGREDSPLVMAPDAREIDTTELSPEQTFQKALELVRELGPS